MSENVISRTPATIAGEINRIKSQTNQILGAALGAARNACFEIGRRLEEAKSLVPHGEWGAWLSENVDYSESTANNLMRIYREYGDEQIDMITGRSPREVFEGLSQSQLVALFDIPAPERMAYVEEHREEIAGQSVRELQRQIKEYKVKNEAQEKLVDALTVAVNEGDRRFDAKNAEVEQLRAELEAVKATPIEAQVVVQELSEEQMAALREKVRAEAQAEARAEALVAAGKEYEDKLAEYRDKLAAAEEAAAGKQQAGDQKELEAARKATEAAEKKVKKLEEKAKEAEAALAEAQVAKDNAADEVRREYEKKLRAAMAEGDVRGQKIRLYLEDMFRLAKALGDELTAMEAEDPGAGQKMRAKVSVLLSKELESRGVL